MTQTRSPETTLKQVAHRAGVSLTTASLVLNERPDTRIAPSTRQRILQSARELGYRGRSGRRQCRLFFLIGGVPGHSGPFEQLPVFAAAQAEAEARRATLQAVYAGKSGPEQIAALDLLADGRTDGLLLVGMITPEALDHLVRLHLPAVQVGSACADPRLTAIQSDNGQGMALLLQHLAALGHRRIAFCGGRPDTFYEEERYQVYLAASLRNGSPPPAEFTCWKNGEPETLERWLDRLRGMAENERPTAILADKQAVARELLARLEWVRWRVPEQVSLAVFDDPCVDDPEFPPVTCIRRPRELISRLAVGRLLEELLEPELPRVRMVLPVELVVRGSTGPPRAPWRDPVSSGVPEDVLQAPGAGAALS